MRRLRCILALVAACKASPPSTPESEAKTDAAPKPRDTCRTDDDCVVDYGHGCCGWYCSPEPPVGAVNRRTWEAEKKAAEKACASETCPDVGGCGGPRPSCTPLWDAQCQERTCALVASGGPGCNVDRCASACGPVPEKLPGTTSFECGIYYAAKWSHCCCAAAGGSCEGELRWACSAKPGCPEAPAFPACEPK